MSVKLNVSCSEWWFFKISGGFCSWKQKGFERVCCRGGFSLSSVSFFFWIPIQFFFLQFEIYKFWVSVGFGVVFFDFLPPILRLVEFCNCFAILVAFCRFDIITMDYLPWFDMQPKFGPI